MIELSEELIINNLHALIDNIDVETMKQVAKEQPNFRSFYLSYGQEGHLNNLLESYFDSTRKPTKETGSESKADAICIKNGEEFRFQLKQIVNQSIITMNGIRGKSKTFIDPKLIRSAIQCKPNHKPFYKRNELDVMVADVSPLTGVPTFLYKLIDDFESPSKKQIDSAINNKNIKFSESEGKIIEQYIEPTNKIIYNPAGFYENGWTDDLDEITSKLFSNDYNLRNYDNNIPKQTIKDKTHSTLINYL